MPIRKTTETVKKGSSSADTRNVSSKTTQRSMKKITSREREQLLIDLGTDIQLILVKIDAGSFMMGSPEGELGKGYNETSHQVVLTKDYWIGQYPVTQRQYAAVAGVTPIHMHYGRYDMDQPVGNISWHLARRFCNKLNRMIMLPAGYRFDLPTEAQWEYACRAGTTTALNSGRNLTVDWGKCPNLAQVGWYYYSDNHAWLSVGQKKPNAWGLYDMHGNVHEWCRDWYEWEYASDPEFLEGQAKCQFRVARGGCYRSKPENCRSASRDCFEPKERSDDLGFRLALVPIKK